MISYRRSDSAPTSNWLAAELRAADHEVFIDAHIEAGERWREVILEHVHGADVVLAMIGAGWANSTVERAQRGPPGDDVLRVELETALRDRVPVVPVLIDDASMPRAIDVARPFRPLLTLQAAELRSNAFRESLEPLLERLRELTSLPREPLTTPGPVTQQIPSGQDANLRELASNLTSGKLVTVLGPQSNEGPALADRVAARFGLQTDTANLAWVSQQVFMSPGRLPLCQALRAETEAVQPSAIHRFLADVPAQLRAAGHDDAQLIVTTNYDTALERAFDDRCEPYDIALFVASGPNRGRFVHIPWWDLEQPRGAVIVEPDAYTRFPFDDVLNIDRTVIVKLHGGTTEPTIFDDDLADNFVVTEDDYIAYLAQSPINKIVPAQILSKIRSSSFLFLGYPLREWHVRVFLQRVWDGQPLGWRSTVVAPRVDLIERRRWANLSVDVVEEALPAFTGSLAAQLVEGAA
jgi:hypothetical protein